MSKYKFRIDKPEPSDENINRHKDFSKVHANHQRMTKPLYKTPLYKNPKVFLVLLLVLLLVYVIAEYTAGKTKKEEPKPKKDTVKTAANYESKANHTNYELYESMESILNKPNSYNS